MNKFIITEKDNDIEISDTKNMTKESCKDENCLKDIHQYGNLHPDLYSEGNRFYPVYGTLNNISYHINKKILVIINL